MERTLVSSYKLIKLEFGVSFRKLFAELGVTVTLVIARSRICSTKQGAVSGAVRELEDVLECVSSSGVPVISSL